MIFSFDTKTFLYSKIRCVNTNSLIRKTLLDKDNFFLKNSSGPKNFISDLIFTIEKNNLAKTTFNFINSDIHFLNLGFYSPIWERFQPKEKNRVIVRLDGIGIDSDNIDIKKVSKKIDSLINKGSYLIYQSQFSKNCFTSFYKSLPPGRVIYNGAINVNFSSKNSEELLKKIKNKFNSQFFTLAGRFSSRKRIYEITKAFNKYELGNLVVLSDVPNNLKFKNKRIIYLGMINPNDSRNIISKSKGLIHFDKYDWCPNIVIGALCDAVPVICSNFGGTPEIVGEKGLIIKEFPNDLPHNMEGINYVKSSFFPDKLFKESILDMEFNKYKRERIKSYNLNKIANEYVKVAENLIK